MDGEFWRERWVENEIHFHRDRPNPRLVTHCAALGLEPGSTLFVPLCGKSVDMTWLAEKGHRVVGVELSEIAVEGYFAERGLAPRNVTRGRLEAYSGGGVTLYCGDFFDLEPAHLGRVSAVYDRAALVALPAPMRDRYVEHLGRLAPDTKALLITLEYDQREMDGPPFAVHEPEVRRLFGPGRDIRALEAEEVLKDYPRFSEKGMTALTEKVFLLSGKG